MPILMRRSMLAAGAAVAITGAVLAAGLTACGDDAGSDSTISVTSSTIEEGGEIPDTYACSTDRDGESPPLAFENIPAEAASLALVMRDDTVRRTHWVVVDIPVTTTEVQAGSTPDGATLVLAYESVCPGSGSSHTYVWSLYALDGPTPDAGPGPVLLANAIAEAAIGTGELTATYTAP